MNPNQSSNQQGENKEPTLQNALSLSNTVLILGGTLFTIAGFFVSLNFRVSALETTLKDFPLYRIDSRLGTIESAVVELRADMRARQQAQAARQGEANQSSNDNKQGGK